MALPDRFRGFFTSRRATAVVALVCIALTLISVNIIAARFFTWRLDLTRDILSIVADSTDVDPDRRPSDGSELVARMSALAEAVRKESTSARVGGSPSR